ncbi:hypothetical protein [Rhizobium changzhiense]|uniref:Uncharacterized protein n=1 Tax=Rhizobium changzhiense TaxID=2692317 RepID=A0ABR6A6A1_9HYPH|nr:hypothetical protein [Rhizobium changzhiense]MBA5802154.1 hypothetical protein [Rhizobium changzhiense]NNU47145.1 hypothetical protein [Rhizobium changzhiense]
MAFITATSTNLSHQVTINVNHIVAVVVIGSSTVVQMAVPDADRGPYGIYVAESYSDIVGRISTAEAYGPGR